MLAAISGFGLFAQTPPELSVEKIMSDTVYIGEVPDDLQWSRNSDSLFFRWKPFGQEKSGWFGMSMKDKKPKRLLREKGSVLEKNQGSFSKNRERFLFERNGDIFLTEVKGSRETILAGTAAVESEPVFSGDEQAVLFQRKGNLFRVSLSGGGTIQLTDFQPAVNKDRDSLNAQDQWLLKDQTGLFDAFGKDEGPFGQEGRKGGQQPRKIRIPPTARVTSLTADPTIRFIVYTLADQPEKSRNIDVPNYVTRSGYTENIPGRTKVGSHTPRFSTWIYDRQRDSVYQVPTAQIPKIKQLPAYLEDYPETWKRLKEENEDRPVHIGKPVWSPSGSRAIVNVVSLDNKDRWIMGLDPRSGELEQLEHQHDEAWIGGPGVGRRYRTPAMGWIDEHSIYFQSEATGYSHLYTLDVASGQKKQLTSGSYEVQTLQLSRDHKTFYFTANREHPGITHFYRLSVSGGEPVQLTSLKGGHEVTLSPDEKWLAIRYSATTKPWEVYLQENKPGAVAQPITNTTSAAFRAYPWKEPEMISFKNRHGTDIYAQVFLPSKPLPNKPAVVFVHSNGYLQNVHYWWSYHFREYMFNNLLVDKGFTVINIDYTASSGYGRDIRTGIYRHMGGKDLSDLTDGAKLLVSQYGVNPEYIGLYGGSYGGFLTLMALFTEPDVFKSGAALRSVTDWAHYNQGYTSNILNEPLTDEKAYRRSSPIYFADGLKGSLLMTHGIVDVNVNFQDIVRLTQRLIELGKEDWELAVYPLEDHNFEAPSSWTDQYKRILELFEETLTE